MMNNIITTSFPLVRQSFNAIEIHPCRLIDQNSIEQCEDHQADFWSVYIHLSEGGLECIADFSTEELAIQFNDFLDSFKCNFTFDSEGSITWCVDDFDARARGHEMDRIEEIDPELYQQLEADSEMQVPLKYMIYDRRKFKKALARMIDKHDCNEGIHWITIDCYLDEMCKLVKS